MKKLLLGACCTLALVSCNSNETKVKHAAVKSKYEHGKATISGLSSGSNVSGVVMLEETSKGLQIDAYIEGLDPGKHGFHIHEYGDLANNGQNAGGHYNPRNVKHGYLPKDGLSNAHAGDLGNIEADAAGHGEVHLLAEGLTLSGGEFPTAGRAFIIHINPDDFGQPTGNAGARVAGGPILIVDRKLQ